MRFGDCLESTWNVFIFHNFSRMLWGIYRGFYDFVFTAPEARALALERARKSQEYQRPWSTPGELTYSAEDLRPVSKLCLKASSLIALNKFRKLSFESFFDISFNLTHSTPRKCLPWKSPTFVKF